MKWYNKGQAALEFLTTYGWAFLVILVMIGGLTYFGVFDVNRLLPEGCDIDGKLDCGDSYALFTNGSVRMQIRNGHSERITIDNFEIIERSLSEGGGVATCTLAPALAIPPGTRADVHFVVNNFADCGLADNLGEKKSYDMTILYTQQGTTIQSQATGTITTAARS